MRHLPLHAALLAGLLAGASLPIRAQALDDSLRQPGAAGLSDPAAISAPRADLRHLAARPALPLRRPEGRA